MHICRVISSCIFYPYLIEYPRRGAQAGKPRFINVMGTVLAKKIVREFGESLHGELIMPGDVR